VPTRNYILTVTQAAARPNLADFLKQYAVRTTWVQRPPAHVFTVEAEALDHDLLMAARRDLRWP
jgi:hypothetical protein